MRLTNLTEIAEFPQGRSLKQMMNANRNWGYAIAKDEVPGTMYIEKHGMNDACAAGDAIIDESSVIFIKPSDEPIEAISLDGGDEASGIGAEGLEAFGVDINWNPVSAELIMNGTVASIPSTVRFMHIYRVKIIGSGEVFNLGDITIRPSGGGATMAMIKAGYGITQRAVMPVFAGCKFYVNTVRFEGSKTGALTGEIDLVEWEEGQGKRVRHPMLLSNSEPHTIEWRDTPKVFNEKTLVWLEAKTISTASIIAASFDGVMMRYKDSTV